MKTNTEDITIGTIIYQEDYMDSFPGSYFMMMLIGRTDENMIAKDYSQEGIIEIFPLTGSWETEYTLDIKIPENVLKEQIKVRRRIKMKTLIG